MLSQASERRRARPPRAVARRVPSKLLILWALALVASGASEAIAAPPQRIEFSLVRIVNHSQRADWAAPWNSLRQRQTSGSGFVIDGGLVMTNAHVVSDARLLLIYLNGDSNPHQARVLHIGHDCDLAVLEPLDRDLLGDVPALSFGGLPELGTTVETYGYPAGGQQISATRGVVSRVEAIAYSHSGVDKLLAAQTDAAINPGNSGGPVVQGRRVVGVAFQAATKLENVGYFIPVEVIQHFLLDIRDGVYDGYPDVGMATSTLENPAARRRAGMRPGETGVQVHRVLPESSADGHLVPGDVVLRIDGHDVANDGIVASNGLRLALSVIADRHQVGEPVVLDILRNRARQTLEVRMARYPHHRRRWEHSFDRLPRYYIYAGLIFVPLERDVLESMAKPWSTLPQKHLLHEFFFRTLKEPGRLLDETIMLLKRLDHPINVGMAVHHNLIAERVNGREIRRLEDVIEATEANRERFHEFEWAYYGRFGVLEREAAARAHPEVLERYGVSADRRL